MTRTAILLVLVATLLITQGQPRVQADGSGGKQEAFSRLGTDLCVLYEEHAASIASPQLLFDSGYGFIQAEQAVQAATPIVFAAYAQANKIATTSVAIILTEAPSGLKQFDLNVTLNPSNIARINAVHMPGLNGTTTPASLPSFQVSLSGSDVNNLINSSSTNITLATLEVQGISMGTTLIDITLGPHGLIDDNNASINTLPPQSGTLTVTNFAPTVNIVSGGPINQGNTFSGSGSFTDPDDTSWEVTFDYGDSSQPLAIAATSTSFSLSNPYPSPGEYVVTVTVDDGDGGATSDSIIVTVLNVLPTLPGQTLPVQDLDGDGLTEDINGKGQEDFTDVVILFQNLKSQEVLNNIEDFDFSGSGGIDFDDVVALFQSFQD